MPNNNAQKQSSTLSNQPEQLFFNAVNHQNENSNNNNNNNNKNNINNLEYYNAIGNSPNNNGMKNNHSRRNNHNHRNKSKNRNRNRDKNSHKNVHNRTTKNVNQGTNRNTLKKRQPQKLAKLLSPLTRTKLEEAKHFMKDAIANTLPPGMKQSNRLKLSDPPNFSSFWKYLSFRSEELVHLKRTIQTIIQYDLHSFDTHPKGSSFNFSDNLSCLLVQELIHPQFYIPSQITRVARPVYYGSDIMTYHTDHPRDFNASQVLICALYIILGYINSKLMKSRSFPFFIMMKGGRVLQMYQNQNAEPYETFDLDAIIMPKAMKSSNSASTIRSYYNNPNYKKANIQLAHQLSILINNKIIL